MTTAIREYAYASATGRVHAVQDCFPLMSENQQKLLVNLLVEFYFHGQADALEKVVSRNGTA
jgi:hypothetical protein